MIPNTTVAAIAEENIRDAGRCPLRYCATVYGWAITTGTNEMGIINSTRATDLVTTRSRSGSPQVSTNMHQRKELGSIGNANDAGIPSWMRLAEWTTWSAGTRRSRRGWRPQMKRGPISCFQKVSRRYVRLCNINSAAVGKFKVSRTISI